MLSARTSTLRDWGLFILVALVPATAIGLLGLRALQNEEAAILREMRVVLEQNAGASQRGYDDALRGLEKGTESPIADMLSLPPAKAAAEPTPTGAEARKLRACQDLAHKLRSGKDGATTRQAILADCESARSSTGRWLWPVVALSAAGAQPAARVESWLHTHGAELSAAERQATLADITRADWLTPEEQRALMALVTGPAEESGALESAQRYAMRMGRPSITWSHDRSRGRLVRQLDGGYSGFVVSPTSLARAIESGWPPRADGVAARLVIGRPAAGAASFEVLEDGAHIELHYADRDAVEARTQRSKRILLAVAAFASVIAMALVALLFARMRNERRVSALRTDFVAAVSHELRTPIASIRMLSELLADGSVDDDEERDEMHQALAREAKRLGDTVNRLLGFSRMEAGKHLAKRAPAKVAEPVQEAIATIRDRHPEAMLESDLDETLEAAIDVDAVKMAVSNLLTNALKYAQPPYRVRVYGERGPSGSGVRIDVEDAGPGLSRQNQKRIFRPFERADDRLSEATDGSGIGLSLVSHVARSHDGRAGVEGELGRGSTFYLWLPSAEQNSHA